MEVDGISCAWYKFWVGTNLRMPRSAFQGTTTNEWFQDPIFVSIKCSIVLVLSKIVFYQFHKTRLYRTCFKANRETSQSRGLSIFRKHDFCALIIRGITKPQSRGLSIYKTRVSRESDTILRKIVFYQFYWIKSWKSWKSWKSRKSCFITSPLCKQLSGRQISSIEHDIQHSCALLLTWITTSKATLGTAEVAPLISIHRCSFLMRPSSQHCLMKTFLFPYIEASQVFMHITCCRLKQRIGNF